MNEQDEARKALEEIAATRRSTARRVASPKGYYALVGFGVALLVLGRGFDGWVPLAFSGVTIVIVFAAMGWYTKHTGAIAWATMREKGAWRAWLMIAVAIAGLGVADIGLPFAIGAAVVTFASIAVLGPQWDAAWVRSIEEQK